MVPNHCVYMAFEQDLDLVGTNHDLDHNILKQEPILNVNWSRSWAMSLIPWMKLKLWAMRIALLCLEA